MRGLCRQLETSLGRPEHTLNEAERLLLERHLAECDGCRQSSAMSRTIANMVTSAPTALSESAQERALAKAFARAAQVETRAPRAPWAMRVGVGLAIAAAMLLGMRSWLVRGAGHDVSVSLSAPVLGPAEPTVAAVHVPSAKVAPLDPTASSFDAWVEVSEAQTQVFGAARVSLVRGARVRYDRQREVLELGSGQVTVAMADVSAAANEQRAPTQAHEAPFVVHTQQGFRVVLLAAEATITQDRVDVVRGTAQVMHEGQLVRRLGAGESYVTQTKPAAPPAVVEARRSARVLKGETAILPAGPQETASALLVMAQQQLAARDVASARRLIARAEQRAATREERAEAGTLRAECALIEHRPEQAARAYLLVAKDFADLPAGENALFAAAQLSAREADVSRTRGLLVRYLEHYPQGRFADAARTRLLGLRDR